MTKHAIRDRLHQELDAWSIDGEATLEDLDVLIVSLDAALDDCREFLDQQFTNDDQENSYARSRRG